MEKHYILLHSANIISCLSQSLALTKFIIIYSLLQLSGCLTVDLKAFHYTVYDSCGQMSYLFFFGPVRRNLHKAFGEILQSQCVMCNKNKQTMQQPLISNMNLTDVSTKLYIQKLICNFVPQKFRFLGGEEASPHVKLIHPSRQAHRHARFFNVHFKLGTNPRKQKTSRHIKLNCMDM